MALNSLAVLETYLKDIIFTEEAITSKVENRDHIFEIKDAEKTLGFISLYDLKAYVYEHEDEAKNYWVKNIDNADWKNVYEHPYFQRRKPQLISTETLKNEDDLEFFILIKGQKSGPYEKYELMEKVDAREILLSDMVSFNGGHEWVKLFQVSGFERRSLRDNDSLPGKPSSEFLNRPSEQVNNINETTDAISSLAFLGNQRRGKTVEHQREVTFDDEINSGSKSSSIYKWLLISSVIGIIYFLYSIKNHLGSPFEATPSAVGEQAEMLTPINDNLHFNDQLNGQNNNANNNINDQRRNRKFESRKMNPISPVARKSFMETEKFIESNGQPAAEDSNYYYDNAAPMELDPVRAQISKENFDNGGDPGPAPEADPVFSGETSN